MTITDDTPVTDDVFRARAGALANMLTLRPERHKQTQYGDAKPENECGTVGCVAGWSQMWERGIVVIAPDGTMTWDPAAMGSYWEGSRVARYASVTPPTLYRSEWADTAFEEGRRWLGLDDESAYSLFVRTVGLPYDKANEVAVLILRELASGGMARDFGHLSVTELGALVGFEVEDDDDMGDDY